MCAQTTTQPQPRAYIAEFFGWGKALPMVPAMMSLRSRALRGVCVASVLVASGCANSNFRWVEGPPAAPGSDGAQAPATTAAGSTASRQESPAVSPDPFSPEQRQRITLVEPWVTQAAREHGLDPALVHGVIWVESRHQLRAKSSAGARGLMQLMPATANAMARQMGATRARVYDAEFNIMAGSMYLARQSKRYDGDIRLALAAYNAGAGNVDKWLARDGELPPNSVRYVELVMDAKRRFEARQSPPPVTRPESTMLAKAEQPPAVVPAPPPAAGDDG
ncbi:MAG: transglycosylase SLT domain-containing protein, partial [Nannocystaceae bacterium]|nr:transglycosylase SLT domain-containing protein [Nannocystaceae bacterium]